MQQLLQETVNQIVDGVKYPDDGGPKNSDYDIDSKEHQEKFRKCAENWLQHLKERY